MTAIYDQATGTWVQRPTDNGSAPAGVTTGPGGSYLRNTKGRGVQAQMNSLLRADGDYMRINEKKGQQFAAGRGLLNSSLAAQAGRQAAIAGAAPIATADAQIEAQADAQNVDALNQVAIANLNKQNSSAQSTFYGGPNVIDADQAHQRQIEIMRLASELNISEADAERMFRREQGGLDRDMTREGWTREEAEAGRDRGWRSTESEADRGLTREEWNVRRDEADADRGWRTTEAERDRLFARETMDRESRLSMFSNVLNQSLGTIFSSPDFFRDPASASGFLEFFTSQFGTLFDRFFTPGGG